MPSWLAAQPYAHRGLHDAASGIIENTPSAFRAAIDAGYGIECDVQISADGKRVALFRHDVRVALRGAGGAKADPPKPLPPSDVTVWDGSALVSGLASQSLTRIVFDGKGRARAAERWDLGKRIRDVAEAPDGTLWLLEDANPGALIHVTPKEPGARRDPTE